MAAAEPTLEPHALLGVLRAIESRFGRQRTVRWGERTLDLDLLLFGDELIQTAELIVPHPRLVFRRFVLAPAAEVAPNAVEPWTRRTVSDLLANLDRRPSLVALDQADPQSRSNLGERSSVMGSVFRLLVERLGAIGLFSSEDMALPSSRRGTPAIAGWLPILRSVECSSRPFVVAGPGSDRGTLRRGEHGTPTLVPESQEPEQIVSEIVATCAATRS